MMMMDFLLPPLPLSWDEDHDFVFKHKISKTTTKQIEAAGHAFMARLKRYNNNQSLADYYELSQALLLSTQDDAQAEDNEPESKQLLASDPTNWKSQDHYAILGLSAKRYAANNEDIKRAYRRKVLIHHPDKKAHLGGNDNFFKCIQKAWEIMTNPKKRRQWDSCDPTFDETLPKVDADLDFYRTYRAIFESEKRFSKSSTILTLGDAESSREQVESFYQFWFAFESWRTFERRDEEDTDKGGSRDEKRWLDRKNVAARKKLKKEDIQRVNRLIDQAFALDPRIKQFKADEKYAKSAKKREREEAERIAAAAKASSDEAAALEIARVAEMTRELQLNGKKDRELLKNAIKKERKAIRRMMRDNNNFLSIESTPSHEINHLEKVEIILASNEPVFLESVRLQFESVLNLGHEHQSFVLDEVHLLVSGHTEEIKTEIWTSGDDLALKKAVLCYPGGSINRWQSISKFVSENGDGVDRLPQECIKQAKKIYATTATTSATNSTTLSKSNESKQTSNHSSKDKKEGKDAVKGAVAQPTMLIPKTSNWTIAQQLELEGALKKYPASDFIKSPADRWDKVSGEVIGKDKKDVKARMKALAEFAKKNKN